MELLQNQIPSKAGFLEHRDLSLKHGPPSADGGRIHIPHQHSCNPVCNVCTFWDTFTLTFSVGLLTEQQPRMDQGSCKQTGIQGGSLTHGRKEGPAGVGKNTSTPMIPILYYIIFYYTIYSILYYTILYYTILYYTILYYTILYYTILYYTILYYTILYYTILYYTILYYTILYYTILYYTILYYHIILYEDYRNAVLQTCRGAARHVVPGPSLPVTRTEPCRIPGN